MMSRIAYCEGRLRRASRARVAEAALTTELAYVRPAKVLLLLLVELLPDPPPGIRSVAPSITTFDLGRSFARATASWDTP
jgi:hypothetical protein